MRGSGHDKASNKHPVGLALRNIANQVGDEVFEQRTTPSNDEDIINVTFAPTIKFFDKYPELKESEHWFYLDSGPYMAIQKTRERTREDELKYRRFKMCHNHPSNIGLIGDYDEKRNHIYNEEYKVHSYKEGRFILLLCQSKASFMFPKSMDVYKWAQQTIQNLRKYTDRPIVIRPHPRNRMDTGDMKKLCKSNENVIMSSRFIAEGKTKEPSLFDELSECHAAITYNSAAATDSLLFGIKTYSFDEKCLAWDASLDESEIPNIEEPLRHVDRDEWLKKMAYASWNIEEFGDGTVRQYLCSMKEKVNV